MDISVIDILSYYLALASVKNEDCLTWNLIKNVRTKLTAFVINGFIDINYQVIPNDEYERINDKMCDLMVKDMELYPIDKM